VKKVLWDVDTQVDFVWANGKLAVPNAEDAMPAMKRLVEGARAAGVVHLASADDHELTDDEISETPDFATTYPAHCLRGTRGAEKIEETVQDDPVPIGVTDVPEKWFAEPELLIFKKHFDVFTNPNTDRVLSFLDPDEAIVFGVATDVCNNAAVRGLVARGRNVTFVEEASRGLDEARVGACLSDWRGIGVRFATVDEVLAGL